MSSDPIEVLRRMRDGWAAGQINEDEKAALATALASLSAPKPESAEAVGWAKRDACGVLIFDHAEVKPTAADYAGLEDGETFVPLFTAPPRPEASAPVGVEGRAREAVALALDEAGCYTEANNVRRGIDLDEYRVELSAARIALAQQPAAVDEATRRDAERYRFLAGEHSLKWEEELDAAIDQARGKGGAWK